MDKVVIDFELLTGNGVALEVAVTRQKQMTNVVIVLIRGYGFCWVKNRNIGMRKNSIYTNCNALLYIVKY